MCPGSERFLSGEDAQSLAPRSARMRTITQSAATVRGPSCKQECVSSFVEHWGQRERSNAGITSGTPHHFTLHRMHTPHLFSYYHNRNRPQKSLHALHICRRNVYEQIQERKMTLLNLKAQQRKKIMMEIFLNMEAPETFHRFTVIWALLFAQNWLLKTFLSSCPVGLLTTKR